MLERSPVTTCIPSLQSRPKSDCAFVGVQFAEHPVCERVNDRAVAVVDICASEHEVDNLAFLVAQHASSG